MPSLALGCERVTRKFWQVINKKHLSESIRGRHRERIRKKFCHNVARLLSDAPKGASPEGRQSATSKGDCTARHSQLGLHSVSFRLKSWLPRNRERPRPARCRNVRSDCTGECAVACPTAAGRDESPATLLVAVQAQPFPAVRLTLLVLR